MLEKFDPGPGGYLPITIDDSPTSRYGRHVEGAGVHHNPTPGPVGSDWLYGHNWVCMALLCVHPLWGVIAMPLWSMLYVRHVDVPQLDEKYGWQFATKHSLALQLVKSLLWLMQMTCGVIRVVIVRFADGGWAPYFCTNPEIDARDILATISARWTIEEHFHDTKEIWGAEQQQVRNVRSNIGCWHLNCWLYLLVELISWDKPQSQLSDRLDRPWDNPSRGASHADRRRAIRREMLEKQFTASLPMTPDTNKIRQLFADLISLSA